MAEKYKPGLFQKKYIEKCHKIGNPLSNRQVKALEKIIQNTFGVRFSEKAILPTLMEKPVDVNRVSGEGVEIRTYKALWCYARGKGKEFPTNEDALEFYEVCNNPLKLRTYKSENKIRGFGETSLRDLRRYLESKKLI